MAQPRLTGPIKDSCPLGLPELLTAVRVGIPWIELVLGLMKVETSVATFQRWLGVKPRDGPINMKLLGLVGQCRDLAKGSFQRGCQTSDSMRPPLGSTNHIYSGPRLPIPPSVTYASYMPQNILAIEKGLQIPQSRYQLIYLRAQAVLRMHLEPSCH